MSLADSTSALVYMMFAYAKRLCLAAELRSPYMFLGTEISSIKILSTKIPFGRPIVISFMVALATSLLPLNTSSRTKLPTTFLRLETVSSMRALLI